MKVFLSVRNGLGVISLILIMHSCVSEKETADVVVIKEHFVYLDSILVTHKNYYWRDITSESKAYLKKTICSKTLESKGANLIIRYFKENGIQNENSIWFIFYKVLVNCRNFNNNQIKEMSMLSFKKTLDETVRLEVCKSDRIENILEILSDIDINDSIVVEMPASDLFGYRNGYIIECPSEREWYYTEANGLLIEGKVLRKNLSINEDLFELELLVSKLKPENASILAVPTQVEDTIKFNLMNSFNIKSH